jgi:hexosaminidase
VRAAACAAALAFCASAPALGQSAIIPRPAHIEPGNGWFDLNAHTAISADGPEAGQAARYLAEHWKRSNGLTLRVEQLGAGSAGSTIHFRKLPGFGPESYRLEVAPTQITVSASTSAGLFYGAVSLWQLLPAGIAAGRIASQDIVDEPRYAWRGLLLDSSRHFQSPAFIRSMIDWMAWHKLNVLHWHLTDDQGWRLQIRRYPLLTTVGAWRIPATVPGAPPPERYGGFYTQDEVRQLVAFAAARHVQIVPEIDMPGHAQAAIAAYPELGTPTAAGPPMLTVSSKWGVHTHLFNVNPGTFAFLKNVLDEVMELFPSEYIHIGGDEAVKDEWNASAQVQARARELGVPDTAALQTYFTQEIGRYLSSHGRRLVGWDEIMQPGLPGDAVVMSWHGVSASRTAAMQGNDTVLSPAPLLYLDRRQSSLASEPPGRTGITSLEDVYRFEPNDPQLSPGQAKHLLGVQANIWTEHIQSESRVEWMALPRAAALAEIAWSTSRNWPDFITRLASMQGRYRAFDLMSADSEFGIDARMAPAGETISVSLANLPQLTQAGLDTRIRYTLDGSEPTATAAAYAAPITVGAGTQLRAATFLGKEPVSRTWSAHLDAHSATRRKSSELELCSDRVGLLLEPVARKGESTSDAPIAVDIMNPCWIYRGVDLTHGASLVAAVAALPFNYELGADVKSLIVGNTRTPDGELEVHIDDCDSAVAGIMPLAAAANRAGVTQLPALKLPPRDGRHDVCLKFVRPRLDPMWGLEWAQIDRAGP